MSDTKYIRPYATVIIVGLALIALGLDGVKICFLAVMARNFTLSYEEKVGIPLFLGLLAGSSLLVSVLAVVLSFRRKLASLGRFFLLHVALDAGTLLVIVLIPQLIQEVLLFISNLGKS